MSTNNLVSFFFSKYIFTLSTLTFLFQEVCIGSLESLFWMQSTSGHSNKSGWEWTKIIIAKVRQSQSQWPSLASTNSDCLNFLLLILVSSQKNSDCSCPWIWLFHLGSFPRVWFCVRPSCKQWNLARQMFLVKMIYFWQAETEDLVTVVRNHGRDTRGIFSG